MNSRLLFPRLKKYDLSFLINDLLLLVKKENIF